MDIYNGIILFIFLCLEGNICKVMEMLCPWKDGALSLLLVSVVAANFFCVASRDEGEVLQNGSQLK